MEAHTPSVKALRLCQLPRGGSLWRERGRTPSVCSLRSQPPSPGGRLLCWPETLRFCQRPHLRGGWRGDSRDWGSCRRRRQRGQLSPQRRAFAESGAANAACRYTPSRENAFGALRRARQTRNIKRSFRYLCAERSGAHFKSSTRRQVRKDFSFCIEMCF